MRHVSRYSELRPTRIDASGETVTDWERVGRTISKSRPEGQVSKKDWDKEAARLVTLLTIANGSRYVSEPYKQTVQHLLSRLEAVNKSVVSRGYATTRDMHRLLAALEWVKGLR